VSEETETIEKPEEGQSLPQRVELPWPGVPLSLRVADGFKFGCGLILAGALAIVMLVLFVAVALLVARFTGADVPFLPSAPVLTPGAGPGR